MVCMALAASKTGGWHQLFLMQMVAHHCLFLGCVYQGYPVGDSSGSRFKDLYFSTYHFCKTSPLCVKLGEGVGAIVLCNWYLTLSGYFRPDPLPSRRDACALAPQHLVRHLDEKCPWMWTGVAKPQMCVPLSATQVIATMTSNNGSNTFFGLWV